MIKKIKLLKIKDLLKYKFMLIGIGLIVAIIFGATLASSGIRASLIDAEKNSFELTEEEVTSFFIEHPVIKEIEIEQVAEEQFEVAFFGTTGIGNSLHPYAYLITKDGEDIVNVKESK